MKKKILIITVILCFFIIGILGFKYIENLNKIKDQESQIQELKSRVAELEKQNLDQKVKIEELENLISEKEKIITEKEKELEAMKKVEAPKVQRFEINREFIILGNEWRNPEVQKEIKMTITYVEKREELTPGSIEALNCPRRTDEIFIVIKGKLTNSHKIDVEVDPEAWLRILDVEKEELYGPCVRWTPIVISREITLSKFNKSEEGAIFFIIPRDSTNLYLRVIDAFGRAIPIELKF
jgi:uncharacterized coiled-coil protein SlyX